VQFQNVGPYNIPGTPESGDMTEAVPPALSKGDPETEIS